MFEPDRNFTRVAETMYVEDPDGYYIRRLRAGEMLPSLFDGGFTLLGLVFVLDPDDDPANWPRGYPHVGDFPLQYAVAEAFGGRVEPIGRRVSVVLPSGRRYTLAKEPRGVRVWREVNAPMVALPDTFKFNICDPDVLASAVTAMRANIPVN